MTKPCVKCSEELEDTHFSMDEALGQKKDFCKRCENKQYLETRELVLSGKLKFKTLDSHANVKGKETIRTKLRGYI